MGWTVFTLLLTPYLVLTTLSLVALGFCMVLAPLRDEEMLYGSTLLLLAASCGTVLLWLWENLL